MVVFGEIHVFPPLSWIGLFGAKSAYLHLEAPTFHEVFLSKIHSVITEKQCAVASVSTQMDFLREIHVFLQVRWIGGSAAKGAFSILKSLVCRKNFFQKLTEFSWHNNVLDAAATFIAGFLWRDTYGSSTQVNRPIWSKRRLFPPCKTMVAGSILLQNLRNPDRKTMC
jgi:hypothetical protein